MSEPIILSTEADRDRLAARIACLPVDAAHQWDVVITRKRDLRTNGQLRLYWRWVRKIADATGDAVAQVDLGLRLRYAPEQINLDGDDLTIPGDVTRYDPEQFSKYLDWLSDYAWSELAVELPRQQAELKTVSAAA